MDNVSFTKLYGAVVKPVLEYGSEIWGHRNYTSINSVFHRACRYCLNIGKFAPNVAVVGDTGWICPIAHTQANISRLWIKLSKLPVSRITHRVFLETKKLTLKGRNNWCKRAMKLFDDCGLNHLKDVNVCSGVNLKATTKVVKQHRLNKYSEEWYKKLMDDSIRRGGGGNKLRVYRLLKDFIYEEPYVYQYMNKQHRRAYAHFRMGVAPLKIETDSL